LNLRQIRANFIAHHNIKRNPERGTNNLGTSEAQIADWKKKADQLLIDQLSIDDVYEVQKTWGSIANCENT